MSVSHPIEAMCYDPHAPSNEAAANEIRQIAERLRNGSRSVNDAVMLLEKLAFCLEKPAKEIEAKSRLSPQD